MNLKKIAAASLHHDGGNDICSEDDSALCKKRMCSKARYKKSNGDRLGQIERISAGFLHVNDPNISNTSRSMPSNYEKRYLFSNVIRKKICN